MQTCEIDGCDKPYVARGWCSAHYSRWRNHGDPLGGSTFRRPKGQRRPCSVPDCTREERTLGLCSLHYQRFRMTGTTDRVVHTCSLPECDKRAYSDGYCRGHWERWHTLGDPRRKRLCSVDGCEREAPAGKRTWCVLHYTRWHRDGEIGPAQSRFFREPRPPRAGHRWCTSCKTERPISQFSRDRHVKDGIARVCKPCNRDMSALGLYGLTPAKYDQMLAEQGGVCAICQREETATHQIGVVRRLSVDHDHKCCAGKRSCGKCVRGLLCARCNSAVGLVFESPEIIGRMLDYVTRSSGEVDICPE